MKFVGSIIQNTDFAVKTMTHFLPFAKAIRGFTALLDFCPR